MLNGDIVAGPYVRLACERHLADLKEGPHRGLTWSLEKIAHVTGYFRNVLRLNGGQFEGLPFELRLWQAFIVGSIFGWLGEDGYRRYRTAYIEIGKGNGKSPLAAGIGLYCLTSDGESRAEVYAAASRKEQAQILFRDAVAMREQSPQLTDKLIVYGGLAPWNMFYKRSDSFFRTISADDKQSGPRPHCSLCDEVHEHDNGNVIDMLRHGFKFRRQPLLIEITNSGVDRFSICRQHHELSVGILRKTKKNNDTWFSYVCALDDGDSYKDKRHWVKANPNLGVSIENKYLQEQIDLSQGLPTLQSEIRRLNFCEWVEAATPLFDPEKWLACENKELDLSEYRGSRCWAGLDLSARNDLTALALVFARPDGSGYDAFVFFWSPAEGMRQREDRDRVPYTLWRDEGYLEATPGSTVEYEYVARRVIEFRESYGLHALAFDRWRIDDLKRDLDDQAFEYSVLPLDASDLDVAKAHGLLLVNHGQGFKDMTPTVEALTDAVTGGKLRVRFNPVLRMCSANAVIASGSAEEKKFDKRKSTGRIDGIVALSMALRCADVFGSRDSNVVNFVEL